MTGRHGHARQTVMDGRRRREDHDWTWQDEEQLIAGKDPADEQIGPNDKNGT
jgi:hypothetical protein